MFDEAFVFKSDIWELWHQYSCQQILNWLKTINYTKKLYNKNIIILAIIIIYNKQQ